MGGSGQERGVCFGLKPRSFTPSLPVSTRLRCSTWATASRTVATTWPPGTSAQCCGWLTPRKRASLSRCCSRIFGRAAGNRTSSDCSLAPTTCLRQLSSPTHLASEDKPQPSLFITIIRGVGLEGRGPDAVSGARNVCSSLQHRWFGLLTNCMTYCCLSAVGFLDGRFYPWKRGLDAGLDRAGPEQVLAPVHEMALK